MSIFTDDARLRCGYSPNSFISGTRVYMVEIYRPLQHRDLLRSAPVACHPALSRMVHRADVTAIAGFIAQHQMMIDGWFFCA